MAIETDDDHNSAAPSPALTGELPYSPLWHLVRIGWPDAFRNSSQGDESVGTRVFIIDNGAYVAHPYLTTIDQSLAIDLRARPRGLSYSKHPDFSIPGSVLDGLALSAGHRATIEAILAMSSRYRADPPAESAFQRTFPSHGTSAAGIIGARLPSFSDRQPPGWRPALEVPFTGVDPSCTIVPVATSMKPDPEALIRAFAYALHHEADVIHLPRGVAVDWKEDTGEYDNVGKTIKPEEGLAENWDAFEAFLVALSMQVPVVCAAGNSGESTVAYPGSLARPDNGIITVGAATAHGFRASYSNYGEGLTLVAPSDDAPAFSRHQMRLNERGKRYVFHDYASYAADKGGPLPRVKLSMRGIFTTDIPGQRGYTGATPLGFDDDDERYVLERNPVEGAFTLFGGTSAASAIVAGVASLVARTARANDPTARLDGRTMKELLTQSCSFTGLHLDVFNDHERPPSREQLFGSGMIRADKAVALVH
jgi:subtilisin family serine protease